MQSMLSVKKHVCQSLALVLPVCVCVCMSLCVSVCVSVCLYVFVSVCLSSWNAAAWCSQLVWSRWIWCSSQGRAGQHPCWLQLTTGMSVCLSVCMCVCLFVCMCVCVSVCLSVCLCVCLSVSQGRPGQHPCRLLMYFTTGIGYHWFTHSHTTPFTLSHLQFLLSRMVADYVLDHVCLCLSVSVWPFLVARYLHKKLIRRWDTWTWHRCQISAFDRSTTALFRYPSCV